MVACLTPRFRATVPFIALLLGLICLGSAQPRAAEPGPKKPADKKAADKKIADRIQEVAGSAEFLRSLPKHFATLKAVDTTNHRVTLLLDGETLAKVWPLIPEVEVKVAGWWGRPEQLTLGDRVWVWFKNDRSKQPVAVAMLADELSEQDIHGPGLTVSARAAGSVTLKPAGAKKAARTLQTGKAEFFRGATKAAVDSLKVGDKVYVQSSGPNARLILDPAAVEARRAVQKAFLQQRWQHEGLPGTVAFLHIFSGEMDLILDHEAMRWGRSLKLGDKVTLQATPPIPAVVRHVRPWRERTEVRLVVNGTDQADLVLGQRIALHMPAPAADVQSAVLPPDADRPRNKAERIEWFLASIYCSCGVAGDICTGHFYTLASCNPNGCGMPNMMRNILSEEIDKGKTDRQILEQLLKEQGPDLLRPHLMP
jgi:hypothetical protein